MFVFPLPLNGNSIDRPIQGKPLFWYVLAVTLNSEDRLSCAIIQGNMRSPECSALDMYMHVTYKQLMDVM